MGTVLPERFETERLVLTPVREDHAQIVFERWGNDPQVARYMTWKCEGPEGTHAFAAGAAENWRKRKGRLDYLISVKGGEADGPLGAFGADIQGSACCLGYCLMRPAWGRGYATEITKAFSDWLLSQPATFRVWAYCDVENIASAHVLEKSGFQREGRIRRAMVHPNLSAEPRDCFLYARVR